MASKIKKPEGEIIKVINVPGKKGKTTRNYTQVINQVKNFGKEIKISPKSAATINEAGFKIEFNVPTVSVNIAIGKNYSADLVMTEEAWNALNKGQKTEITTVKQFRENFL